MTSESDFIAALRGLATDPGARDLMDDAAVLEIGGTSIVLTCDTIIEGIHYLAADPAEDVAWKLVAVNLSDLAAKGARPIGVLLGYALGDDGWDAAFARGLATALGAFGLPLIGGDTVAMPAGAPRVLALTAIGAAGAATPSRSGAQPGDQLWISGTIGDAGAGLMLLGDKRAEPAGLIERYRNPRPRIEAGQRLAPIAAAMMDVSDGLLIDAAKMAAASGCGVSIELETMPMSDALIRLAGEGRAARLAAASAGDDYELLFAAPEARSHEIVALAEEIGLPLTRIGAFEEGRGLMLSDHGEPVALPAELGFEHRG